MQIWMKFIPWHGWLAVWLMLLKALSGRVRNFWMNLNFVVLYSVITQLRFVATLAKLQGISNSWLVVLLYFHRLCFYMITETFFLFPQAYIWRGWERLRWDFGQRKRNEPWWPNPWCLTDPQWASENQQYGGRGEQINKMGIMAFGCQIDWQCVASQQSVELPHCVWNGVVGLKSHLNIVRVLIITNESLSEITVTSLGWVGVKLWWKVLLTGLITTKEDFI